MLIFCDKIIKCKKVREIFSPQDVAAKSMLHAGAAR